MRQSRPKLAAGARKGRRRRRIRRNPSRRLSENTGSERENRLFAVDVSWMIRALAMQLSKNKAVRQITERAARIHPFRALLYCVPIIDL